MCDFLNYLRMVFLVVLGRGRAARLPTSRRQAVRRIGTAGLRRMKTPKTLVPRMAPILANNRCIPCDEDLRRVRERERTINQLYLTAKTAEPYSLYYK